MHKVPSLSPLPPSLDLPPSLPPSLQTFLRRRKYKLYACFYSATQIHPVDSPIEFEVSIGEPCPLLVSHAHFSLATPTLLVPTNQCSTLSMDRLFGHHSSTLPSPLPPSLRSLALQVTMATSLTTMCPPSHRPRPPPTRCTTATPTTSCRGWSRSRASPSPRSGRTAPTALSLSTSCSTPRTCS